MSFDKLIDRIKEMKNPTVAGLDPNFSYVPEFIREKYASISDPLEAAAKAVLEYNYGLIDALCDIVPAVKPQAAYYEMYGWYGMKTFAETVSYAQSKGMYVIADCKRNDIGSTMEAYATAHLGEIELYGKKVAPFGADALTVNGYLGSDGIRPLLGACAEFDKGIFVLVKTSNPSSGELQDRKLYNKKGFPSGNVYEVMGDMCENWALKSPAASTATPVSVRSSAQPTPNSSRNCANVSPIPSSLSPVTVHRAAAEQASQVRSMRKALAQLSTLPALSSALTRRKAAMKPTSPVLQEEKRSGCATISAPIST